MMEDISYTKGPRILSDGTNLDADVVAGEPKITERGIEEAVTNLLGLGYEPGQKNLDQSDL